MKRRMKYKWCALICFSLLLSGCITPKSPVRTENRSVPLSYNTSNDSTNIARLNWKQYFDDENLIALIDTALKKNQELNITLQEIEISRNEIRARKGEYLPFVGLRAGAGVEKEARFTRFGAVDKNIEIAPGTSFPEPFTDYQAGLYASWEVDIWKKLRNAKKAALVRYLGTVQGKNFMVTNLISEIANSYYELMALDNLLDIIEKNVEIQTNGLHAVRQQKQAAKVTELAVTRFEAQLLNTKNRQYEIRQRIIEIENRIHLLTGGFPKAIPRSSVTFNDIVLDSLSAGIPLQLLANRPDIRQAELNLAAAKLDIKVARANFYPSLRIEAGAGFQAYNPAHLIKPESMLFNLAGDLIAPLVNRNAITAMYRSANARQIQEVYNYERSILNAYLEVVNQLSQVDNFRKSYQAKSAEVHLLTNAITISNSLFSSARADYLEVLLTQREALESKMDLIEIKLKQMNAKVNLYRSLGGGWN